MRREAYTQGVLRAIHHGTEPRDALANLKLLLEREGRGALFHDVLRSLSRETRALREPTLSLYDAVPPHEYQSAKKREVPALIGGWLYEDGEVLIDASYKKALIDIYRNLWTAS